MIRKSSDSGIIFPSLPTTYATLEFRRPLWWCAGQHPILPLPPLMATPPQLLVALNLPPLNCFLLLRHPVSFWIHAQRCTLAVSVMRSRKCQFSAEFRKERTVDLPVESPRSFRCNLFLGALFWMMMTVVTARALLTSILLSYAFLVIIWYFLGWLPLQICVLT
jgi:L-asparagine transporter-like permease